MVKKLEEKLENTLNKLQGQSYTPAETQKAGAHGYDRAAARPADTRAPVVTEHVGKYTEMARRTPSTRKRAT